MITVSFYKNECVGNGQANCREILREHCKQMAVSDTKKNGTYQFLFMKLP